MFSIYIHRGNEFLSNLYLINQRLYEYDLLA
jgi:hypothetical protein